MRIFLSWSGERSKLVARSLRDWLPLILHYVHPWLSEKDISAGDRWGVEIGRELEECNFGIICLTRENLNAPWMVFEAGALSKIVSASSVCPYLLDLEYSDVWGPLSQFQAKKAEKNSTFEMIQSINTKAIEPINSGRLLELFEALWPKLDSRLQQIPSDQASQLTIRSQGEVLEDLVMSSREMAQRFKILEDLLMQGLVSSRRRIVFDQQQPALSAEAAIVRQADLEQFIASVWEDTLELEKINESDNFFDLGGNSLHLVRVLSKLKKSLSTEIPLTKLFEHQTVRSLAEYLCRKQEEDLLMYLEQKQKGLPKNPRPRQRTDKKMKRSSEGSSESTAS